MCAHTHTREEKSRSEGERKKNGSDKELELQIFGYSCDWEDEAGQSWFTERSFLYTKRK